MVAKSRLDGLGFVDVAQGRGGAVGIEVLHLVGIDLRIRQGTAHGAAWAVHVGCCHMTGVCASSIANQLGINTSTTRFSVFIFFQHHHTCAFAQHKTVAVTVPRTRRSLRVIIAGGKGSHGGKATQTQW